MDYISFPKLGITINISPTALKIGSVEIKWYAVCIMLGFALAIVYAIVQGKKQGFKSDTFVDLAIIAMVFGLIGICGSVTSCKSSSETMYSSKKKTAKKINRNYKVRGNNQRNSSTYHSY